MAGEKSARPDKGFRGLPVPVPQPLLGPPRDQALELPHPLGPRQWFLPRALQDPLELLRDDVQDEGGPHERQPELVRLEEPDRPGLHLMGSRLEAVREPRARAGRAEHADAAADPPPGPGPEPPGPR